MVWQQQVSAIVMLCRLTESGICKCARYWPATVEEDDLIEVREAGLEVRLRDFDDQDNDFSVRKFYLFLKSRESEWKNCQNGTFEPLHEIQNIFWPK